MYSLFNILPSLPEGFQYHPEFLSEAEERRLVDIIKQFPLKPMQFQGFEAKRKVMSFGYDYHFANKTLTAGIPVPEEFKDIIARVACKLNIPPSEFVELLLTEYEPGTVINWHRDAPPFNKIAGISLCSDCTFKLRPYAKHKRSRAALRSFTVERRSLYVMEGEAREQWEHSIAPVKDLRYSITLRSLR
jgi:alkylated DNA repair dioxygenase AlkB